MNCDLPFRAPLSGEGAGNSYLASQFVPVPAGGPDSGAWGTPLDFGNQELSSRTIKTINLGSRETYPPGNQVPARPGHWAVSFPEGPGPSRGQGKGGKGARPHKISGLEPENSPKGDCVQRLWSIRGQQRLQSPKGFAEIHGDRPRLLRFRGVRPAPTYAGYPLSKKNII